MKGIIFTSLQDMVEEKFGLAQWNELIEQADVPSCGVYTAGGTYSDEELSALVVLLSQKLNLTTAQLIEAYGLYLFPILAAKHPSFIKDDMTLKDFIKTIDEIIHVEVHKLYPESSLPTMDHEDPAEDQLILLYKSPRKLCALAVGLLQGASTHFKTPIDIQHPQCMHSGSDHCRLEINFGC